MKKSISILFSFIALVAFLTVNVANAQSPKTDKKATKVEQTVEKKSDDGCCTSKAQTTTATTAKPGCCTSAAKAEAAQAKTDCASAGKTCGGCSSKASAKAADEAPVPRR